MFKQSNMAITIATLILSSPWNCMPLAYAGSGTSGGGDLCEDRIKLVRDDLKSWILNGGPQGLLLPSGIDAEQYSKAMLESVKMARVKCVGAGDAGYPIGVSGTPKVCKFESVAAGLQITCDYTKFLATSDSDQYILVHHEYAGLANIEMPNKDDSHYEISNQISGYLENQIVKKLAVKPTPVPCKSVDVHAQQPGFRCATKTGAIYERVSRDYFGEAWKGPDGVIWGDLISEGKSQPNGIELCKDFHGDLPSKAEFERGYISGFREVLPHWDGLFWTSTVIAPTVPNVFTNGWWYNSEGAMGIGPNLFENAIRCVAR